MADLGHDREFQPMLKAARLHRFLPLLVGILLVSLLVTNAINGLLSPALPAVLAAEGQSPCTSDSQRPSFGGTINVGPKDVLCSNVTIVGGTVSIQGLVQGSILA